MSTLIIIIGIICIIIVINKIKGKKNTDKGPTSYTNTNASSQKQNKEQFKQIQDFDENEQKGFLFEQFIENLVLREKQFILEDHRRDVKTTDGTLPLSSKYPDFDFLLNRKVRFSIECKYRSRFYNDSIHWAEPYQIKNYTEYEAGKETTVFVAIGIAGTPENPEFVYLIPLRDIKSTDLSIDFLLPYIIDIKSDTKLYFDIKNKILITRNSNA